jgi:hypothetical protein
MRFFRRDRSSKAARAGRYADAYLGLRRQILTLTPEQLGPEAAEAPMVALLMETGYPEAVATLVGVVDGTTSLYFSNGGGMIGAGEHPRVARASERWLETCARALHLLAPLEPDPPPPDEGTTQLVAVTPHGLRGARAAERELGEGEHVLSALFHAAQDVITEIRLLEESRQP